MRTILMPILVAAATICAPHAQSSAEARTSANSLRRSNTALNATEREESLRKANEELTELQKTYTDQNPNVVEAKRRVADLERTPVLGDLPATSTARFGQRLANVVRRGDVASPGSIIVVSPMSQEKLDQLSEDLTVLNYIFARNFESVFGEKSAEYRLGVPITMSGGRVVETSYFEGFGVLIKAHVPFPVLSSGDNDKKSEPPSNADSDWEKARRALFGAGDGEAGNSGAEQIAPYDEKLVGELKKQMFDALKSAANIRNLEPDQTITVAILGGPNFALKLTGGGRVGSVDAARPTIMTIRVTKAQADAASKDPSANDLSKQATVTTYFDAANASPRGVTTFGGGFGGGGYGSFGRYPSAYGVGGGGGGSYAPSSGTVGR
jgi:hypothetical protein